MFLAVLGKVHLSAFWKSAQQSKITVMMVFHLSQKLVPTAFCYYRNWITAQVWESAVSPQWRDGISLHCYINCLLCLAGGCAKKSGVANVSEELLGNF